MVIVLVIGLEVHGFKPLLERLTFKDDKNPWYDFFRRGSKAVGPML
jgi:hypothetical protein